jgi:hypothetical protein
MNYDSPYCTPLDSVPPVLFPSVVRQTLHLPVFGQPDEPGLQREPQLCEVLLSFAVYPALSQVTAWKLPGVQALQQRQELLLLSGLTGHNNS